MEYLGIFAERRQSEELQRREKEQRGRGVVRSAATRYVLSLMPPIFVVENAPTRTLCFVLCFFCCSLLQLNHNFPQTFGEDSEMLAEDLYYHRVVII